MDHPYSYGNHEFYTFILSSGIRRQGFRLTDWWTKDKRLNFHDSKKWVFTIPGSYFTCYIFSRYISRKLINRFLLILRAKEDRPSLDIVPDEQDAKPRQKQEIMSIYGKPETWPDKGKVRDSCELATNSRISVTLRKGQRPGNKPWPGEKHYFVNIQLSAVGH